MESTEGEVYVHFFLFRCSACQGYVASMCASLQSNLEPAQAHTFKIRCHCGWARKLLGATAARHWVEVGGYIDLTGVPECSMIGGEVPIRAALPSFPDTLNLPEGEQLV
jgi:hypothetical protein